MEKEEQADISAPEVEDVPPEPTVDELKSELEKTQQLLDAAKQEAKAHEANVTRKANELAKREALDTRIGELHSRVEVLTTMVGDLIDSQGTPSEETSDEAPKRKRSEEYLSPLKQEATRRQQEEYNQRADTQWGRLEGLGITKEDDVYWDVLQWLSQGQLERAEIKLNKLEAAKNKEQVEPPKAEAKSELTQEQKDEIVREYLEKQGALVTDIEGPSAISPKKADIIRRYAQGDPSVSEEQYEKAMKS